MIDGEPVKFPKNENGHDRGLNIVCINPSDCGVFVAEVFDTYKLSEKFDKFIDSNKAPEGCIVVAACKDECTRKLSTKAKFWFSSMGSSEIGKLKYR